MAICAAGAGRPWARATPVSGPVIRTNMAIASLNDVVLSGMRVTGLPDRGLQILLLNASFANLLSRCLLLWNLTASWGNFGYHVVE